jgi:hypothetical protein
MALSINIINICTDKEFNRWTYSEWGSPGVEVHIFL